MRAAIAILAVLAAAAAARGGRPGGRRRGEPGGPGRTAPRRTERRDRLPPQRRPPDEPGGGRQGQGPQLHPGAAPFRRRTAARRGKHPLRPQPRARLRRPGQTADAPRKARSAAAGWSAPPSTSRSTRAPTACSPSGSAPAAATRRRPGPRSTTTTCGPASTGWSSPSPSNNGATTPYHAVTNFQILPRPGHGPEVQRRQGLQRQGRRLRLARGLPRAFTSLCIVA